MKNLIKLEKTRSTFNKEDESNPFGCIGSRIVIIRGDMGQKEFSKLTGVHNNTLQRYENGARDPSSEYLQVLCYMYPAVNPVWLLIGQGTMVRPEILAHGTTAEIDAWIRSVDEEQLVAFNAFKAVSEKLCSKLGVSEPTATYNSASTGQVLVDQSFIDNLVTLANKTINTQHIDTDTLGDAHKALTGYLADQHLNVTDANAYGRLLVFYYRQIRDYGEVNMSALSDRPELIKARHV